MTTLIEMSEREYFSNVGKRPGMFVGRTFLPRADRVPHRIRPAPKCGISDILKSLRGLYEALVECAAEPLGVGTAELDDGEPAAAPATVRPHVRGPWSAPGTASTAPLPHKNSNSGVPARHLLKKFRK